MKRFKTKVLLPLALLCVLPFKTNAGIISVVQSDSSGGLADFSCVVLTECAGSKVYFNVAPISIDFVVGVQFPQLLLPVQEIIFNSTQDAWTDFHWSLEPIEGEFDVLLFVDASAVGFQSAALPALQLDLLANEPIEFGNSFIASLVIAYSAVLDFNQTATFRLTQFPTVASVPGPSVPEPTTLALFGLALAGLGFSRRRQI